MANQAPLYTRLQEAINSHTPCVLASVIFTEGSSSARAGDKAIIFTNGEMSGWVGGGCCQGVIKKLAPEILKRNQPLLIRVSPEDAFEDGKSCFPSSCASEGTVDIFLEPIANGPSILLYGETPVSNSVTHFARELGVRIVHRHLSANDDQIKYCKVAVVATQGNQDLDALRDALESNAKHILFIASRKKSAVILKKLEKLGIQSTERIISPSGIEIGAKSPAEIALSVIAQVVSFLNCEEPKNEYSHSTTTDTLPSSGQESIKPSSCCGGQ